MLWCLGKFRPCGVIHIWPEYWLPREDLDDVTAGPDGIAMEVSATAYSHLYTYNFEDTRIQPVDFALLFLHMVLGIVDVQNTYPDFRWVTF